MSWDVFLFSGVGLPERPIQEWPNDFRPPPLGSATEVRDTITRVWPGTDWSDPAWGWFESPDLATEINFQVDGPVDGFTLHIRGGSNPVPAIIRMCDAVGAVALDTSTGDLLANDTESSGYLRWVKYKDQFVKRQPPADT